MRKHPGPTRWRHAVPQPPGLAGGHRRRSRSPAWVTDCREAS